MRIFFLLAILILIGGAWVGGKILHDAGYVLVAYDRWTVETSLWVAAAGQVILLVLFYLAARLLLGVTRSPSTVRQWLQESRLRRTTRNIAGGLREYSEGRWKNARKMLVRSAEDSEMPMINYLVAAWAADRQGDDAARDKLLSAAREATSDAELAVGITEARIMIERQDWEGARARIAELRAQWPDHPYLIQLQKQVCLAVGDWLGLSALLGDLKRFKVDNAEQRLELEKKVYTALLSKPEGLPPAGKTTEDRLREINEIWSTLPVNLRRVESIIIAYVEHLIVLGAEARAEVVLRNALKRRWRNELVRLYGLVQGEDCSKQLAMGETWLRDHPNNAILLLTLGRLSLRNQLWGKARKYLEASLGFLKTPEAYAELGRLLAFLGEKEESNECFRRGLEKMAGSLIDLSLPEGEYRAAAPVSAEFVEL